MIKKETIEKFALEALSEEYFIVNISIRTGNIINVVIDGDKGVNIQKCIELSRSIENKIDRDVEDFELSVYSAGLGKPLKVYRQYVNNIGKVVEVIISEGKPVSGLLKAVDELGFDLEVTETEKIENKKKKVEVVKTIRFQFDDKPEVRNIVSFK